MVNTHIHVTGEPLTRGYVPDDTPFEENVFQWLCPLYATYDAADERTSAHVGGRRDAALGHHDVPRGRARSASSTTWSTRSTTSGIRGRVGNWVWDLPPEPSVYRQDTDAAIDRLARQLDDHPCGSRPAGLGVEHGRRPHDVQRPAVAGGHATSPASAASG